MIRTLTLLGAMTALMAADPSASPWDKAVAAGFPEVRGATLWVGAWRESPSTVTDWAQRIGSPDLHLRLADGRWLLHGLILHPAAEPAEVLEPAAVPWGDPGQPTPNRWNPWGLLHQPAVRALLQRSGVTIDLPQDTERTAALTADEILGSVRLAAVLAITPEDRRALGQVLTTLDPGTPMPDLAALPSWRLTYDPTTRALLQERVILTPPGPGTATTRGSVQYPPWQPRDVPGLLAALGDPTPSRTWTMEGRLATIGDQALAALAWVWGLDQERLGGAHGNDLARRLADLLARHGDLVTALGATPDLRPLLHEATLLASLPEERRRAAAALVAEDWSRLDRAGREALAAREAFGTCLTQIMREPAVIQVVGSWPVEGPLRPLLACWHDAGGDPTHLDALLTESLAATPAQHRQDKLHDALWSWALDQPSTARFALLAQLVRRPLADPQRQAIERLLQYRSTPGVLGLQKTQGYRWNEDLFPAWWLVQEAADRSRAQPSPVLHRLQRWMGDEQPTPTIAQVGQDLALRAYLRGTPLPDQQTPPTLPAWWQEELAKAQGKPVLLHLTATVGCWPCEAFHTAVTSRPGWRTWAAEHLHHVVIDGLPSDPDANRRLAELSRLYGLSGVPNLLLLGPDGVQRGEPLETERDLAAFIAQVARRLAPAAQ